MKLNGNILVTLNMCWQIEQQNFHDENTHLVLGGGYGGSAGFTNKNKFLIGYGESYKSFPRGGFGVTPVFSLALSLMSRMFIGGLWKVCKLRILAYMVSS